jgi:hypothetical protein
VKVDVAINNASLDEDSEGIVDPFLHLIVPRWRANWWQRAAR